MIKKRSNTFGLLFLASVFMAIILAACSSGDPEDRDFDVQITNRQISSETSQFTVSQGDTVTLRVSTDERGTVHLHGYDIEKNVHTDEATTFDFTANATGRFNITFHPGASVEEGNGHENGHSDDDVNEHGAVFNSGELASGATFSFQVPEDLDGKKFHFHNHMSHENQGEITVGGSGASGTVEVEINQDGSFEPHDVEVQHGTTIVWTNNSDAMQRVVSGDPPENGDDHEHGEDEEEISLGTLEVRPR